MTGTPPAETADDATPDRYLYALVDLDRGNPAAFDATGVDGAAVRVLAVEDIGAVVHDCNGLYDSEDPVEIRSWLLSHQEVVDEATETFGTPLPVRFDTVIEGGDRAVREFVRPLGDTIRTHLDELRHHREYRIGVRWEPEPFEERMRRTDDRLQTLAAEIEDSDDGTAFLREKQYEQRLQELREEHGRRLEADLRERIEPVVADLTRSESTADTPVSGDAVIDDGRQRLFGLTVLAATDSQETLGDRLDAYVEAHDVEVRFTGPWPPYSFAPELSG